MRTEAEPEGAAGARDAAAEDPRLVAAAEALADGGSVDWAERLAESPDLAGPLVELQVLSRLQSQHQPGGVAPREVAFRWGDLDVLERIGEGTSAEVWRAWDPSLEREVALKLSRPGVTALRPIEEARRLARVRHPHVVAVLGVDVRDGRTGMWMELIDGLTMEQQLDRQGPLSAHEAAGVGLELCRALAAVHGAGLVHGDVTTRNVVRERGGRIVLMDLGSAAPLGDASVRFVTGTPLATAPEVLAGSTATARSDLWSLGALLFRAVTGRWPVEAATLDDLRRAHAEGRRLRLRLERPDLPAPIVRVIERALDPDPASRPADAAAFEAALARALGPEGRADAESEAEAMRRRRARAYLPAGVAGLVLLVVLIATARWGRSPGSTPPVPAPGVAPPTGTAAVATRPPVERAQFLRVRAGLQQALASQSTVRVGDELALAVRAGESLHWYVLNEDDQGQVHALYPVRGGDLVNPLPARRTVELPGAVGGEAMRWQVSSPARRERFLVLASRSALPMLEERLRGVPGVNADEPLSYAVMDPPALERLRGVGRITRATPARTSAGALDRVLDALAGQDSVYVTSLELVHE